MIPTSSDERPSQKVECIVNLDLPEFNYMVTADPLRLRQVCTDDCRVLLSDFLTSHLQSRLFSRQRRFLCG